MCMYNNNVYYTGINEPVDYGRYPSQAVQYKWIEFYLKECFRLKGLNDNIYL